MVRAAQYGRRQHKRSTSNRGDPNHILKEGDRDWYTRCQSCGQVPTVHPTKLCGPCCFGDASTTGDKW